MKNKFLKLIDFIKKSKQIILFHHINPDFDSLGSQISLFHWIKENFPHIKISIYYTEKEIKFIKKVFKFENDKINFKKPITGIILDTGIKSRISGENFFSLCEKKIAIDHHIQFDKDFDFLINEINISSTCEIIFNFFYYFKNKYIFPKISGKYLYYGLITDTGCFTNKNVFPSTFIMASKILEMGVDIFKIYDDIFSTTKNELKLKSYIGLNMKVVNKLVYFIITKDILKKFNVKYEIAKSFVFIMKPLKKIEICCLITENSEKNFFSISLRSKKINVEKFALKYNGGGHKLAAGLSAKNMLVVNEIIKNLTILSNEK